MWQSHYQGHFFKDNGVSCTSCLRESTRSKYQAVESRDVGRWFYQKTSFNLCHSGEKADNFQSFQTDSLVLCFSKAKVEIFLKKKRKRVVGENSSSAFSRLISLKLIFRIYLLSCLSLRKFMLVKYYLCYFSSGRHSWQQSDKFKDFFILSKLDNFHGLSLHCFQTLILEVAG